MKLVCLFLVLMLVPGSQGKWSINVNNSIKAKLGSDVVIPCTFDVPGKYQVKQLYWKKKGVSNPYQNPYPEKDMNAFVFHPERSMILPQYQGKTSLLEPTVGRKNCSLKIRKIKQSESGLYLRVAVEGDFYSFWHNLVSISIDGQAPKTSIRSRPDASNQSNYVTIAVPTPTAGSQQETETLNYVGIFVPLLLLLLLLVGGGAYFVYTKRRRLPNLRAQVSSRYANFNRKDSHVDFKSEIVVADKVVPAVVNTDEPIYANYSATQATPRNDDVIYENVDYTR